jgi:hypothetical protein
MTSDSLFVMHKSAGGDMTAANVARPALRECCRCSKSVASEIPYLGIKAIVAFSKKEVVLGAPKLEEDTCESSLCSGFVLGKFDLKSSRSSGRHCSKPCERIHMDITSPKEVGTIGIFRYFLMLADNYSDFD